MEPIIEFLRTNAIWLGLAGVIMLIALIGFMFDSKTKKNKKTNKEQPLGEPDVVVTSENMNEVVPSVSTVSEPVTQTSEVIIEPVTAPVVEEVTNIQPAYVAEPTTIVEPVVPITDVVVEPSVVAEPVVPSFETMPDLNQELVTPVVEPMAPVVTPEVLDIEPEPVVDNVLESTPIVESMIEPEPVVEPATPIITPGIPVVEPYIAEPTNVIEPASTVVEPATPVTPLEDLGGYVYTPPTTAPTPEVLQTEPVAEYNYVEPTPVVPVNPTPEVNQAPEVNAFAFDPNTNTNNL